MPKTRGESIFFTAITAWMMVYVMTLYNTVLAMGSFTNTTFLTALKGMWIEYIIIAIIINSLGVLLMLQSGSGISAISSVPYAFSEVFPVLSPGT